MTFEHVISPSCECHKYCHNNVTNIVTWEAIKWNTLTSRSKDKIIIRTPLSKEFLTGYKVSHCFLRHLMSAIKRHIHRNLFRWRHIGNRWRHSVQGTHFLIDFSSLWDRRRRGRRKSPRPGSGCVGTGSSSTTRTGVDPPGNRRSQGCTGPHHPRVHPRVSMGQHFVKKC